LRILELISRAVLKSSEIAFPTLKPQSTTAEARRMQPDHLAIQTNPTYLMDHYADREALRTFPVIRIHNINISDRSFTKPRELSPETSHAKSYGSLVGNGEHPMR
jgi:predicted DNA-binding transcriptional regulator YafY